MGIGIKHRAVLMKTSDGEKVIHLNVNCPNYGGKKDVCFDSWNGNAQGWKTDGGSVNAISGATVEEMLKKAPAGYNLVRNNCIDYQNAVMEYCKKGSLKPRGCTGSLCTGVKGIVDIVKSIGKK
uniref:Uncharacterized protein n=1 Tax=Acrobeloides nanus TaxID=290746 RepID=A0A914E2T6_9BILA